MNVQSMILANSTPEEAEILRKKWSAEAHQHTERCFIEGYGCGDSIAPTKESKPVSIATSTSYLDKLVSKRIQAIQDERDNIAVEAAKARQRAMESAERELEKKFADFIRREIATVSDGALHFQQGGESYSVALTGGVFVLSGSTIRDTKIEGPSGSPEENLVNTLANLKLSDKLSQHVAPVVSPEQIELSRLRDVTKRYVGTLDELKRIS
jgi:hypothetical protein